MSTIRSTIDIPPQYTKYAGKVSVYIDLLEQTREFILAHEGTLSGVLTDIHLLLLTTMPFGINPLPALRMQTSNMLWRHYHECAAQQKARTLHRMCTQSDYIWPCANGFITAMKYGADYHDRKVYLVSGGVWERILTSELVASFFRSQVVEMIRNRDDLLLFLKVNTPQEVNIVLFGN